MVESTFHNLPRFVRLRSIRQVHPDRPMVASFSTDSYSITADLEVDPESPAVDGKQRGRLLQVYMESRKKETATLTVHWEAQSLFSPDTSRALV